MAITSGIINTYSILGKQAFFCYYCIINRKHLELEPNIILLWYSVLSIVSVSWYNQCDLRDQLYWFPLAKWRILQCFGKLIKYSKKPTKGNFTNCLLSVLGVRVVILDLSVGQGPTKPQLEWSDWAGKLLWVWKFRDLHIRRKQYLINRYFKSYQTSTTLRI